MRKKINTYRIEVGSHFEALQHTGHADRAMADRALALQVADHKTAFFAAKGADYHQAVGGGLQLLPAGACP